MSAILNDRYRVLKTLARGGFSKTYLAEDTHLPSQRMCVIKQLKPLVVNPRHQKSLEKRFQKEAETLEKLSENNNQIPKLYAYFTTQNKFFLVQEFIKGKTLLQIAKDEKITEKFVKDLLINLLPVLNYLHNNGIIHRDIKPANIIIRESDQKPVLIDFGAVKELMLSEDPIPNRQSTMVIGTPGYMPTEQMVGQAVYATDLYALGLVAIFLLTGKNPDEIEKDGKTGKILWQKYNSQKISSQLTKVLDKSSEPYFHHRYPTANAMLKDLQGSKFKFNPWLLTGLLLPLFALITFYLLSKKPQLNTNQNNQSIVNSPVQKLTKCPDKITATQPTPPNANQIWQCFADVPNIPQGTWYYGGSTAWAKINEIINPRLEQVIPQFYLTYRQHLSKPPGSGTGIQMLLDDTLSFAQSSRPLKSSEIETAKSLGIQLKQIPVAIDGIAVIVNHNLPIEGLTVEQIQQIYTGKIKNWQELGGINLPINAYTPPLGSGATAFLRTEILGDLELGENVKQIITPTEAIKLISSENNSESAGIYLASAANLIGQCSVKPLAIARDLTTGFVKPYQGDLPKIEDCQPHQILPNFEAFRKDQYPFTRRLFIVIRDDDSLQSKAGKSYADLLLTDEGQQLIKKADFIPLRSFE